MSHSNTVRLGIIGCGAIAEIYHLPFLASDSRCKDGIALAEPNEERRKEMCDKFGAAVDVADYRELLGKVDGVIIATPPTSHFPIAKWCLENGLHVLCEKPLTESVDEARELVALAEKHGVALAVNQTRRFFPTYQKIRELIQDGVLGQLQSIEYHDGVEFDWPAASPHHFQPDAKGAWSDTGVHLLDSVCYWLGGKPELVQSQNDSAGGPEAMATVRIRHEGCDAEIKVSRLGRLANAFTIKGTKGSITAEAEDFTEITVEFTGGGKKKYKCASGHLQYTDFAKPLLSNFADVVQGKAQPIVPGHDVVNTIELLQAAYDKVETYEQPWDDHWKDRSTVKVVAQPPRILVTGASGFLGGRLVEAMQLSGAAVPVGTIRGWSRAARPARFPVELQLCDIENAEQVDALVAQGFDAIVHTAKTDTRESIVGGTENLLKAAAKHNVGHLIHLSTAEVYGPGVSGKITEDAPTEPSDRLYGDAKIEAEQVCRSFADKGVATTILRPSLIYGPFSTSWTMNIAKRLQSGKWGTFDEQGEGFANLVYGDDLVRAILTCVENDAAKNQTFNINGPDVPTWNEYFAAFNKILGQEPLQAISTGKSKLRTFVMDRISGAADMVLDRYEDKLMEIYLRGGLASKMMKKLKGELDSTPSGGELHDLYMRKATYDDSKIRSILGFQSAFDLDLGMRLSAAWLSLQELTTKPVAFDGPSSNLQSQSNSTEAVAT